MSESINPIGWERDLCERITARYDLDFWLVDNGYPSLTTKESGYQHPSETREATYPESQMWHNIVLREDQELLNQVGGYRLLERPFVRATPEEVYCAASFHCGKYLYLAAEDFVVLRTLEGFKPGLDRERLRDHQVGTFEGCYVKPVLVHVCREIPHGYFISEPEKIPCLHWQPDPIVRQLRPELDPGLVFTIRLLKTDSYDLQQFGGPQLKKKAS